jgi:two-component system, NtrC family, response regulator AtoC
MATLLVIEDEPTLAKNIARFFQQHHHTVEIAADGPSGIEAARRLMPDVAIVDYQLPGLNGLEVIRELHRNDEQVRTVMVSGHANVAVAVDAMKAGSFDLLTKPVPLKTLKEVIDRALAAATTRRALDYYRRREAEHGGIEAILGDSRPVQALRELIAVLVQHEPSDASPVPPILICGETGSGKELVARACHFSGPRAQGAFVEVGCASLPANLMEGELFGYEKGGGHTERRVGLIEAADGGTLFLDEIGELDLGLQAKLLRVLENLKVRRIGSLTDRQINVRVVAATNRDLDALVRAGQFRADLLYRLRVFAVRVPPLRARGGDLWMLAQHFASLFSKRYNKPPTQMDPSAEAALMQHSWPGNVRELSNVIERAVLLCTDGRITSSDLQLVPAAAPVFRDSQSDLPEFSRNDELERSHLVRALEETRWNLVSAANLLSVDTETLRARMDRHALYVSGR